MWQNGKCGMINKEFKFVLEPTFDKIESFVGGYGKVWQNGKCGMINKECKFVLEPTFDEIGGFQNDEFAQEGEPESYALVWEDGKCGMINDKFEIVLEPTFDELEHFDEGYASACKNGLWGLIAKDGKFFIEPKYDSIERVYSAEYALYVVGYKGKFTIINGRRNILAKYYDEITPLDGSFMVKLNNLVGVVGENGQFIIPVKYDDIYYDDGTYILFSKGVKFADYDGNLIEQPSNVILYTSSSEQKLKLTPIMWALGGVRIDREAYIKYHCYKSGYGLIVCKNPLRSIGEKAFMGTDLTSIYLPEGIETIGEDAFRDCVSLTNISIPNSVTLIEWRAFYECKSLVSITLPEKLKSLWEEAFYRCVSLETVYCMPTIPPALGSEVFYYNVGYGSSRQINCTIYVPRQSFDRYRSAKGWNDYFWDIKAR